MLKGALRILASSADEQINHLTKLGLPGGIDELALQYDDAAAVAGTMLRCGELTNTQYNAVKKLNDMLERMSGREHWHLWSVEALTVSGEWKEIRRSATEILKLL